MTAGRSPATGPELSPHACREAVTDAASSGRPNDTHDEAVTQLPTGELRAGAVKARRPRADTRVGGAKRRALHGAEHSSMLGRVMAARTTSEARRGLRLPDARELRFQDDASEPRDHYVTVGAGNDGHHTRRQPDKRTAGRERPSSAPWGEIGGRKVRVAHAPLLYTVQVGARIAGSKERRPLDVDHRHNVVNHQQFAHCCRGDNRHQGRCVESLSPSREGGPLIPRASSPLFCELSASGVARKHEEMLVRMGQLETLDACPPTVQGIASDG